MIEVKATSLSFREDTDRVEAFYLGALDLLAKRALALFCSSKCPGSVILNLYDHVQNLRDAGTTVISGFHSPVEKECLSILLRGRQPIIICPAREIQTMRVPSEWRKHIEAERMLVISPFAPVEKRITAHLAERRNVFVAKLADEVLIAHAGPGGKMSKLADYVRHLDKPLRFGAELEKIYANT